MPYETDNASTPHHCFMEAFGPAKAKLPSVAGTSICFNIRRTMWRSGMSAI